MLFVVGRLDPGILRVADGGGPAFQDAQKHPNRRNRPERLLDGNDQLRVALIGLIKPRRLSLRAIARLRLGRRLAAAALSRLSRCSDGRLAIQSNALAAQCKS